MVRRDAVRPAGAVVGVASERDVLVLHFDGGSTGRAASLIGPGEILALLDEHNVAGKQLHRVGDSLTLVISRENLHEEDRLRAELAKRFGDRVRLIDALGAVSVIGAGINASFQNLRRGSEALAAERHRRRARGDVVFQDYVDDRPRPPQRRGEALARDVYRKTIRLKPDTTTVTLTVTVVVRLYRPVVTASGLAGPLCG